MSNWTTLATFLHETLISALAWMLVAGIVLAGVLLRETTIRDEEETK